jgi:hypothetical protein
MTVPVDQSEPVGVPVLVVWIEDDRLGGRDINQGDFVAAQFLVCQVVETPGVDAIF